MATPDEAQCSPAIRKAPRKCLILANPKAGVLSLLEAESRLFERAVRAVRAPSRQHREAEPPAIIETLADAAADAGLAAIVQAIPPPNHLSQVVGDAKRSGCDTVVAVGGDGTVRSVAQALVGSDLRLGIVPLGTANNFAHSLGIPLPMDAALRIVAEGVERCVDLGRVGAEYFIEAAGVGLFADAILAFGPHEPRKYELFRIACVCLPLCWNPRAHTLQLTLDAVVEHDEVLLVSVSNSAYLGSGLPMAPEARVEDGQFDVVIVGGLSRLGLVRFGQALLRGRHLELPEVRCVHARRVEIRRVHRGHHRLPVHLDDHIVGYTPAVIEVAPRALRVLAPAPE